jgi:hypothetical protein
VNSSLPTGAGMTGSLFGSDLPSPYLFLSAIAVGMIETLQRMYPEPI